ncbi:YdcF family protein [Coralliovum pocilloporae]|uniref:YdcF family protein n=1 Tax=Coralliovum pocilloporae TaxID=3066369 RepID=UPI003307029D
MAQEFDHSASVNDPMAARTMVMSGFPRAFLKISAVLCLMVCALLVAGFLRFASIISTTASPQIVQADGIVALTGGAKRLSDAVLLLSEGRGKRLLITGVDLEISDNNLFSLLRTDEGLRSCCIDLDRTALDTVGNAAAASDWARQHNFKSLIVVTSAYHIPRSLLEINRTAPEMELIPYPVVHDQLNLQHWYLDIAAMRLLLTEYLKYMLVRIRVVSTGQ